ncbi:hypothetical protein KGF54_000758 [Candida jiufengensis]|uniref:uncharacterized protein n=1 Tax=Candida jiufengensis TaxID=497108 RepID=UPI0022245341|nr:uncharacterized protein KGF54_000758 [Candida jiufengensis]KAI5956283.1 hypothetical protein KGF54_000758 [Candida jiufengensis]
MYKAKSQSSTSPILQKLLNGNKVKKLLLILGVWFIIFYISESILPYLKISSCKWPKIDTNNEQTNILLIADPQLIDNHTYPGRNPYLLKLSQHTVDQYLKRNYNNLKNLKPKYTMFLGDLLDNGRASTDEYFENEVARFRSIFTPDPSIYTNLPGNHDIGFGDLIKIDIRNRFEKTFGSPNLVVTINEVDFIMLDSTSLSSTKDVINQESKKFISNLPTKTNPRILLTHVPLYRDPNSECGPLREKPKFDSLGKGYQYQNSITKEISSQILDYIKPDLIFSGDDHDYCDYKHNDKIREITVKSVSMAMGIWYPAVQLLSFKNTEKGLRYQTEICYLQTPYYNVVMYIILALVSFGFLVFSNLKLKLNQNQGNILPLNNYKVNTILKRGLVWDCAKDSIIAGALVLLIYRVFIVK